MYCKQCGAQMSDKLSNCLLCGAPLVVESEAGGLDTQLEDEPQNRDEAAGSGSDENDETDCKAAEVDASYREHEPSENHVVSYEDVFAPFMRSVGYRPVDSFDDKTADDETYNIFIPEQQSKAVLEGDARRIQENGGFRKKRLLFIGAAAILVLVAVVSVAMGLSLSNEQEYVQAQTHQSVEAPAQKEAKKTKVTFSLTVPGLDDNGSRVPLHIEGTLSDGSSFKNDVFAFSEYVTVELSAGEYEATSLVSPISAEGVMYRLPDKGIKVSVKDDGTVSFNPPNSVLEYTAMNALEQSDELIQTAKTWIAKDKERASKADKLASLARERRLQSEYVRSEEDATDSSDDTARSSDNEYDYDDAEQQQADATSENTTTSNTEATQQSSTSSGESQTSNETSSSSSSSGTGANETSTDQSTSGSSGTGESGAGDSGTGESTDSGSTAGGSTSEETNTTEPSGGNSTSEVSAEVQQ